MKKVIKEVTFDWNSALGDTIKERMGTVYSFLIEQEKLLPKDKGQITIHAGEIICSVFECLNYPYPKASLFVNAVLEYKGKPRWSLWLDPFLSPEELLLYNDEGVVRIFIENLVV